MEVPAGLSSWMGADMTVPTGLERNNISRGYTPLGPMVPSYPGIHPSGTELWEIRESLTWAQDLLKCWSKRKSGLNAALNEHPNIRGTWNHSLVVGRWQLTCYFPMRGSWSRLLCTQAQ